MCCVLLAEEVSEAGDGVIGIANKEGLGLATVVLVAVNVGENGRDLSVFKVKMLVSNYLTIP